MKEKLKSLKGKNIQQLLFVFLTFFLMVSVSYFYVSNIVQDQVYQLGEETMNTIETAVSSSLSEVELIFSVMADAVENRVREGASNEEVLRFLTKTNEEYSEGRFYMPDFMKIYGYFNGEFLDGSGWIPGADYEPAQRPWYEGAVQKIEEIYFSEPYIDAETGEMCISFSKRIADKEGLFVGVLAIDVKLSRITDYVSEQQIADKGYGILISDSLRFTSHKDKTLLGRRISDAGKGYAHLEKLLEEGKVISAERFTEADGTDSIAFLRTVFNGWHIGVIIPRMKYYEQVNQMGVVLVLLGIILMSGLCYMLMRTMNEKLRSDEENKEKSEFLARMSHEMRTPMNAIIGMTDIARKTEDPGRVQYCLGKISDASNHLLGVINDVLDMSKIEAGKMELSETDFVITEMLNRAIAIVGFKVEERHQELEVHIDSNVPEAIVADMQRLTQVLTNLLGNANKFTPDGGKVSVSVETKKHVDGKYILQFEVADNGIGISKSKQATLFRSFEQADGSISRKYGGTGLGLAISQNIINMMGGEIWIDSEEGRGAKFIFTVPVKAGEASRQEGLKLKKLGLMGEEEDPQFLGKCILLAEDIEINQEIVMALLEDTKVRVECAGNGQEALDLFTAFPDRYDLIFMDIHMPEMDGYTATQKIRAMETVQARNIPIIAMTANVFQEDIERCLAAGMNSHVSKPLNKKEVLDAMKEFIL